MRKAWKLIFSNKFITWAILLFQIAVLVAGYYGMKEYSVLILGATSVLGDILLIYEINRREPPEFKMTWMLVIAIIPIFGALLYIYMRFSFISRGIAAHHKTVRRDIKKYIINDEAASEEISKTQIKGVAHYLENIADAPVYADTDVKYFKLGEIMYEEMKERMEAAEKFIFLEFFIINSSSSMWTEIFDILSRKVREGVEVRLMYDGMGSLTTTPRNFSTILDNAGIKHTVFAPLKPLLSTYQNNRDHRKIIVIDGEVAFTGGINIADEYVNRIKRFGHWKDNGIRITGDAVSRFTALFLEMWETAVPSDEEDYVKYIHAPQKQCGKGYIIPYGDCPLDNINVGKRVYLDMINRAEKYVYIMTPYLVIDNEMLEALRFAVERGVDVRIIIPHHPDKVYAYWLAHTYFPELIEAGVKMYEYTPGFIHAKTLVADDDEAIVGTINFDFRSLYLHYECAALIYGMSIVGEIKRDFDETQKQCQAITMEEYKKFNILTKLMGRAIRALAPLL